MFTVTANPRSAHMRSRLTIEATVNL